jgi:hypothetical protein
LSIQVTQGEGIDSLGRGSESDKRVVGRAARLAMAAGGDHDILGRVAPALIAAPDPATSRPARA